MKVTFIYPNMCEARSSAAMQPLCFAFIAAVTPPHISVKLFDEHVEAVDLHDDTDLVAITVHTFNARRAYAMADHYRGKGIPVVLGGFHPSLMPDEAANHASSIVIGDCEDVWPTLMMDAQHKALKPRYFGSNTHELSGIIPDRSIFNGKKYTMLQPIQFGRGCRYSCDFCSIHQFYGNTIRHRPVADIVKEIDGINGRYLFFVDDNFLGNYDATKELLAALIPLRVKYVCQVSFDAAGDEKLVSLLARSGCSAVFIGFESLKENNLSAMGKTANRKQDYAGAIRLYKHHGIMVCGSFVFGYGGDSAETFGEAVDFSIANKLAIAHMNIVHPTPGTRLYNRLHHSGELLDSTWWLSPGYRYGQALMHSDSCTARELEQLCYSARCRFNSWTSILKRMIDPSANMRTLSNWFLYMASNLVSRREIKRKQWSELG